MPSVILRNVQFNDVSVMDHTGDSPVKKNSKLKKHEVP
jgi:hypothetical protein